MLICLSSFLPLSPSGVVPKSGAGTRGLETWDIGEISPPYARRHAAGLPVRICLLPLLCWTGARGTSYTPYVCEYYEVLHVWHSSSLERLHGHEVVMGVRLHRQRPDGDVIPSSVNEDRVASGVVRGSSRHRGWTSTTTSTTFTRERFPLNGLHKGMLPLPPVTALRLDRSWCWAALARKIIVFCYVTPSTSPWDLA